jgi:transposase
MKISEYTFSESEIAMLEEYRDGQKDSRLKIRFIALLTAALKFSPGEISAVLGKSVKTLENWFNQYVSKGIESLNSFDYKPKQPYLSISQINQVIIWTVWNNPENTKEIRDYIRDKFGTAYCTESVRKLLRKHGLKVLRPKVLPGSPPSAEEQKQFIEKYEKMRNTDAPGTVVLFGDAMHPVHQNVPGRCWGDPLNPPLSETNSGRRRLNILGAYNPETYSPVHLTGEENCDAERVIQFLDIIIKSYRSASRIHLILDNARYFHAAKAAEWLKDHKKLTLEFLPPYAPNLNLIERFWRFAKDNLVRNKYYKQYKTFRAKVFQFLNHTDEYNDELKTLMTEKFEIVYA